MTPEKRQSILKVLAANFGTDKLQHGYLPHYAWHINTEKVNTMLEIGIGKGGSAKMWKEYMPKAEIHIMDLFEDPDHMPEHEAQLIGLHTHKGDQSSLEDLKKITTQFDLIIDDGSHNASDMLASFSRLFMHNLKPGGWYVVEDLHCCEDPFYWSGTITSVNHTMLGFARRGTPNTYLYMDKIVFIQKPC